MLNPRLTGKIRIITPDKATDTGAPNLQVERINLFVFFNLVLVVASGIFFETRIIAGSFLLETVMLMLTLVWIKTQGMGLKATLRLKRPSFKEIGITLIVTATGIYVASFIDEVFRYYLQDLGTLPGLGISKPNNLRELILTLAVVALLPALSEEALFRGFVLKSYQRYLPAGKAIFLSALFFGLAHLSISNFWGPFILGILCGWLVCICNSIFPAIIAHFLNNALTIIALYLTPKESDIGIISGQGLLFKIPPFIIAGLILLTVILWFKPAVHDDYVAGLKFSVILKHWSTWLLFITFGIFAGWELLSIWGRL